jgi:hypothetical protein
MSATNELRRRLPAEQPQPRFEPRLPRAAEQPPAGPGWLHEVKHDGFRILAHRIVRPFRNGFGGEREAGSEIMTVPLQWRPNASRFLTMLLLEMATFDRRIAAVESLARDRFDSDCVLGTQFESSQPHHALSV